ncbi:MAG TPA: hypothetical protein VGM90_37925 [Kofleriaceae bacterium]|jgi:hypothetical protein
MPKLAFLVSLSFGIVTFATPAFAEPDATDTLDAHQTVRESDTSRSHLGVTAALGSPLGELGVEYTRVLHPNLELGVGVGLANMLTFVDMPTTPSPQAAIMPRARLPIGPAVLTLGAGLSAGRYTTYTGAGRYGEIQDQTTALWTNVEAGAEVHTHGWFARLYGGMGFIVAHGDVTHGDGSSSMDVADRSLPYVGLSVGRAF